MKWHWGEPCGKLARGLVSGRWAFWKAASDVWGLAVSEDSWRRSFQRGLREFERLRSGRGKISIHWLIYSCCVIYTNQSRSEIDLPTDHQFQTPDCFTKKTDEACSPERKRALSTVNSSANRMWQKFFLLLRMAMISPHWQEEEGLPNMEKRKRRRTQSLSELQSHYLQAFSLAVAVSSTH